MQRDLLDRDGAYARNGLPVARLEPLVPVIASAIEVARRARMPVIATRFTIFADADGRPVGLDQVLASRPFLAREGFRRGSPGCEVVDALPRADFEIETYRSSAFHGTPLELLLRGLAVHTLVLCGVFTNGGVESTARDAQTRDFRVVTLRDAVASFRPDLHEASLHNLAAVGELLDSARLAARLG
jgi:nicotinamidase-related amidase